MRKLITDEDLEKAGRSVSATDRFELVCVLPRLTFRNGIFCLGKLRRVFLALMEVGALIAVLQTRAADMIVVEAQSQPGSVAWIDSGLVPVIMSLIVDVKRPAACDGPQIWWSMEAAAHRWRLERWLHTTPCLVSHTLVPILSQSWKLILLLIYI